MIVPMEPHTAPRTVPFCLRTMKYTAARMVMHTTPTAPRRSSSLRGEPPLCSYIQQVYYSVGSGSSGASL